MRKGIKIDFPENNAPAYIDFSAVALGFEAVTQNAMVNLGTRMGSDHIDEERGTTLLEAATLGSLLDAGEQEHAAAYAAEQTRLYLRDQEDAENIQDNDERIAEVGLEVKDMDLKKIVFNAFFVNVNGKQIGQPLTTVL